MANAENLSWARRVMLSDPRHIFLYEMNGKGRGHGWDRAHRPGSAGAFGRKGPTMRGRASRGASPGRPASPTAVGPWHRGLRGSHRIKTAMGNRRRPDGIQPVRLGNGIESGLLHFGGRLPRGRLREIRLEGRQARRAHWAAGHLHPHCPGGARMRGCPGRARPLRRPAQIPAAGLKAGHGENHLPAGSGAATVGARPQRGNCRRAWRAGGAAG